LPANLLRAKLMVMLKPLAKLTAVLTPKRTWFQFRLRTLLLLVVVVAVPCGWFKWKWDRKQAERRAVAEITKAGLLSFYDWQTNAKQPNPQPPGAAFLRKLLGDDFFANLVRVQSYDVQINDTVLVWLESLPDVESLFLPAQMKLTDAGLENLSGLSRLRYLDLNNTKVTGVGLGHLKQTKDLRWLNLRAAPALTDADLIQLTAFPNLEQLNLDGTKIRSAGLEHLRGLPNLRWLNLSNTNIKDTGLLHLESMTALKRLFLDGTKTTSAAVGDLAKALPGCDITGP
jgi:hypothetical protein